MVNRKGVIKVVEATIAIVVVLGALLIISIGQPRDSGRDLVEIIPPLLDEMARDSGLRSKILNGEEGVEDEIKDFLKERLVNPSVDLRVRVCELDNVCALQGPPTDVSNIFVVERVVSSSVNVPDLSPKKVRVFVIS